MTCRFKVLNRSQISTDRKRVYEESHLELHLANNLFDPFKRPEAIQPIHHSTPKTLKNLADIQPGTRIMADIDRKRKWDDEPEQKPTLDAAAQAGETPTPLSPTSSKFLPIHLISYLFFFVQPPSQLGSPQCTEPAPVVVPHPLRSRRKRRTCTTERSRIISISTI